MRSEFNNHNKDEAVSMEEVKNRIEIAIESGEEGIDFYLSDVSKLEFVEDIKDLKRRYADKEFVREIIRKLQELI